MATFCIGRGQDQPRKGRRENESFPRQRLAACVRMLVQRRSVEIGDGTDLPDCRTDFARQSDKYAVAVFLLVGPNYRAVQPAEDAVIRTF